MKPTKNVSTLDIAISGMRAQGKQLKLCANNIANANTTRTRAGTPYRRQMLALQEAEGKLSGVATGEVMEDMSSGFKKVLMKGHPHADKNGYVQMPNIEVPNEMISMITASRTYQANTAILKKYQESVDTMLELLR